VLAWLFYPGIEGEGFPFLAWFAMVPWGVALIDAKPKEGAVCGFFFAFFAFFAICSGFVNGMQSWLELSFILTLFWYSVVCAFQAIPYALFGWCQGKFGWLGKPFGSLRAAACHCLILAIFPALLPGNITHAFYNSPRVIQILDLGGIPLLLFTIILSNWLVLDLILKLKNKQKPTMVFICLILLHFFILGYGALRLSQFHDQEMVAEKNQILRVESIQPNLPIKSKKTGVDLLDVAFELTEKSAKLNPKGELVVWPEIPLTPTCQDKEYRSRLSALAKKINRKILAPCTWVFKNPYRYTNTMRMTLPSGEFSKEYNKIILFPFGEYIPFEDELPFLRKLFQRTRHYVAGEEHTVFDLGEGKRVIPAICYESVFTGLIRRFVEEGGNAIVNMSDDAWFGKSGLSLIHFSLAVFRSVEYRVPIVRVTNSGVGAFVKATGEIIPASVTPLLKTKITSFPLFIPEDRSIYFHVGNIFFWLLLILFCLDLSRKPILRTFNKD
jgi:apolipoprotein N-acyltransferase